MKTIRLFIVAASVMVLETFGTAPGAKAQTAAPSPVLPAPTPYQIVERGANHQVWERTVYEPGPNGTVIGRKHHYTEIATALNVKDSQTGQWQPANAAIDLLPDGTGAATQCEH
jgi:hypothetical protein